MTIKQLIELKKVCPHICLFCKFRDKCWYEKIAKE